jgi:hypothetical protein
MTLGEIKRRAEAQAISAGLKLKRARILGNEREIGYWTAYIRDRERLLIALAEFEDE